MTTQLTFDLAPLVTPDYAPEATIAERFAAFHAANPHVADALESLAAEWLDLHPRIGTKALVERLRWESGISTHGDPYLINNDFTAHYGRLLISRHPEWDGRIPTRELRAE